MRVEQRSHHVLDDRDQTDPGDQSVTAEQQQMCNPHDKKRDRPDQAELDRHHEYFTMRIDRAKGSNPGLARNGGLKLLRNSSRSPEEVPRCSVLYKFTSSTTFVTRTLR